MNGARKNPTGKTIRRGHHEVYLDPPYVRGGSACSSWHMRLNGHHVPIWPPTKADGVKLARQLLDAILAGEQDE